MTELRPGIAAIAEAVRKAAANITSIGEDPRALFADTELGTIHVAGVGKSGLVGAKFAATLCSYGIPARPLHPTDALHGDVGAARSGDLAVLITKSGSTVEMIGLIPLLVSRGCRTLAVTEHPWSVVARSSDAAIVTGEVAELGPSRRAPSISTAVVTAVLESLAATVAEDRGLGDRDLASNHPANVDLKQR
ncbi:MAG: SIS domain-containing protein [Planctomycetota bacterium]